jgi:hypothetical protein
MGQELEFHFSSERSVSVFMTRTVLMKKFFLLSSVFLMTMPLWGVAASPDYSMFFPYLVNDSRTQTQLVFTNATSQDANVQLLVYNSSGTLANTTPEVVLVPAGTQVTNCGCSLGTSSGWILAKSDVDGLSAQLQISAPDQSSLELTAPPSLLSKQLVFPFVALGTQGSTEIALANPNPYSTRAAFTLYNGSASVLVTAYATLPPYGSLRGSLSTLLGSSKDLSSATHLIVQSRPLNIFSQEVSITGFEVVRGFNSAPQNIRTRKDVAALPAFALETLGNSLLFPQVVTSISSEAVLAGELNWFSLLGVVNLNSSQQTVNFSYYDNAGNLISTKSKSLVANGSLRLTSNELFEISDNIPHSGYVVASASAGPLAAFQGVGALAGASLGAAPAQSVPLGDFLLPALNTSSDNFTALALLNASSNNATVDVSLISTDGVTKGVQHLSIPPKQRLAGFLSDSEFFVGGINQPSGFLYLHSSTPIYAQGLMGNSDKTLAQLSPHAVAAGFIPAPQTVSAISGKVTWDKDGLPVPGVTIQLSKGGIVLGSTTTNSLGAYILQDLEMGVYTLTPSLPGSQFFPAVLTVSLAGENVVDANFLLPSVSGHVTRDSDGSPVPGVTIQLTRDGNLLGSATTDAQGTYLLHELTLGDYSLTPILPDNMFDPPQRIISFTGASIFNANFVMGVLPTLKAITVITNDQSTQQTAGNNPDAFALFGTSEVSLKIEGVNIITPNYQQDLQQRFYIKNVATGVGFEIPGSELNFVDSKTVFVRLILSDPTTGLPLPTGHYEITLRAQSPFDANSSNPIAFYILPPLPVLISAVVESSGLPQTYARYEIDSTGETLKITGFNFLPGAKVTFNGTDAISGMQIDTKYISSTSLTAYLPPQALRFGGMYNLRVQNIGDLPLASGEAVTFQVNNLKPQIDTLDPPGPLAIIGPGPVPVFVDLKINGSNFHPAGERDPGSVVAVTNIEPDIFPAIVPIGGTTQCIHVNGRTLLRVRVYNSAGLPAAGVEVTFTAPGLATTDPSGAFQGGNTTVTLTTDEGGFAPGLADTSPIFTANPFPGNYVVLIEASVEGYELQNVINMTNLAFGDTCPASSGTIVFVSSHQLIVTGLPISSAGKYRVVVANASPGGGYSNEVDFIVVSGPSSKIPQLVSLAPAEVKSGGNDFTLTIAGKDDSFQSDAWINFGTVRLKTNFVDVNTLTATVPAMLIGSPGTVPITVTNPGGANGPGGTSTRLLLTVN